MSDSGLSDDDDVPDLVPAEITKVPVTVITGYLGNVVEFSNIK